MIALARGSAGRLARFAPGIALCWAIALVAEQVRLLELDLTGRVVVDPVVVAILIGTATRFVWCPGPEWASGVTVCAKLLLEISVVLLGATVDVMLLLRLGPTLMAGVVLIVAIVLPAGYLLGRALGLTHRAAILIACGNSICGNAAIGAVAPIVGADARDITTAVSFTAVVALLFVLALPGLAGMFHLSPAQSGVVAGLTVYSVPQVLAATVPIGPQSSQIGTTVKLLRVLMLGPVMMVIAALDASQRCRDSRMGERRRSGDPGSGPWSIGAIVPWFIPGFVAMAACRSLGLMPTVALPPTQATVHGLTVISMAALGLNVDPRRIVSAGARTGATAAGSLGLLAALSFLLVWTSG